MRHVDAASFQSNEHLMCAQKTILLVDDDPHIIRVMRMKLEGAGYLVESAWDGTEALSIVMERRPSLMITDLMMPNLDGFALFEKLSSLEVEKHLPIIILSSAIDFENIKRVEDLKGVTFVSKPFSPRKLLVLVKNLLGESE